MKRNSMATYFIYNANHEKVSVKAEPIIIMGINCIYHKKLIYTLDKPYFSEFEKTISCAYSGARIADGLTKSHAIKNAKINICSIKQGWKSYVGAFLKSINLPAANPKVKIN